MPAPKKPTDHKPKAGTTPGEVTVTDGEFSFVGPDGASHVLPPARDGLRLLPFGKTRRMLSAGQAGQVELVFSLLDVMDIDPTALAALDSLDTESGTAVMGAWYQAAGSDGVTLPQS